MKSFDRKAHWENIYQNKPFEKVSWYQVVPQTSLDFVAEFQIPKTAKIIDIGGGDSLFTLNLLNLGYKNLTVLDVSENAIQRAQKRFGKNADEVQWIVADITDCQFSEQYDYWHDRATFHFLTTEEEIQQYVIAASKVVKPNGIMTIGTFSEQGPEKCSGIQIQQYSELSLDKSFSETFSKINCQEVEHLTPSNKIQYFVFCSFRRR